MKKDSKKSLKENVKALESERRNILNHRSRSAGFAEARQALDELIESAKAHGLRIVACQMSMDIMGIRKEELIDGVELGGVATFISSGEESDMSLFI